MLFARGRTPAAAGSPHLLSGAGAADAVRLVPVIKILHFNTTAVKAPHKPRHGMPIGRNAYHLWKSAQLSCRA